MRLSVVCIVLALILYTVAVWSEWAKQRLKFWMVALFTFGFVFDLIGTSLMFLRATRIFVFSVHSFFGLLALIIMLLHLLWALLAITRQGIAEAYFTRFSRFAWVLWLIAFISGIPKGM